MELKNDFAYYLSAKTILAIAQELHNKSKFSGLNEDQYKMMESCKKYYKKLRSEDIHLQYNCPA